MNPPPGTNYDRAKEQLRNVANLSAKLRTYVEDLYATIDAETRTRPDMASRRWEIRRTRVREHPWIQAAAEDRSLAIQLATMYATAGNAEAITALARSVDGLAAGIRGLVDALGEERRI